MFRISPTLRRFLILSGVIVMVYFLDRWGILYPIRGGIERIMHPLSSFLYQSGNLVRPLFTPLISPWQREKDLIRLRESVKTLATTSGRIGALERDNDELRRQLEVKKAVPGSLIFSRPIAFDRYLVIDRGLDDGVSLGTTVVSGDVLVGKIVKVTAKTASILLPSDPESTVSVWTKRLSRGVIKGAFGQAMRLEGVLQSDPLSDSDVLLTTGEQGYAQNIVVGLVGSVYSEPREVFKTADVISLVDIHTLGSVFVISHK